MEFTYHSDVDIPLSGVTLKGELIIPSTCHAIVLFSHGSGSSRFSARNKMVAEYLQKNNFATLLFDLLTEHEDRFFDNRFNIELLAERLMEVTEWLRNFEPADGLGIGYFGASTGAASALKAAAFLQNVQAIVSRGGRPDLAMDSLSKVKAPTLLIVGSRDVHVAELNKMAYAELECEKKFEVIAGASHLFEESGMMDIVCEKANEWFKKYLRAVKNSFHY